MAAFWTINEPIYVLTPKTVQLWLGEYYAQRCSYSPDDIHIAICGTYHDTFNNIPGQLLFMNSTNGVMDRTFIGHEGRALDLAYSPDGKLLVSCGEDNTIRLWRTGGPCSIIKQKYFELVGTETVTRYRDIQVAEPLITYNIGTDGTTCVAFAPDGKTFAYGQTNGNLTLARVPLWVTDAKKDGNQYMLAWQGGIGPYQLQQNESLNGDSWQNVGDSTTAMSCTNTITSKSTYFRVLDLRTQ